jgi:hypothetical protein
MMRDRMDEGAGVGVPSFLMWTIDLCIYENLPIVRGWVVSNGS